VYSCNKGYHPKDGRTTGRNNITIKLHHTIKGHMLVVNTFIHLINVRRYGTYKNSEDLI